ncbi:MAG: ABC-2 transporter permease, partial [Adlercreutzia sp.]|nr:ABC-2 transporter permease [Adlercreutzia sp.]
ASWAREGLGLDVPLGLTWAESSAAAMTASALLSIAVILAACAVALPLLMRFGMTRATRFVPLVVVLALALGVGLFSDHLPDSGAVFGFLQWLEAGDGANLVLFAIGCLVAALALFAASAPLAAKFYEHREL